MAAHLFSFVLLIESFNRGAGVPARGSMRGLFSAPPLLHAAPPGMRKGLRRAEQPGLRIAAA